jgi:glycerophosphoryl diester phosphodiesterase
MMRLFSIFVLSIMSLVGCEKDNISNNLVIAHRGMPYHAPEETLPSFILARELGADYLEADLQRTKDGIIIALHDNNLKRTTNIAEIYPDRADDPVSTFSWQEIQALDAGSWFNNAYPERARASYVGLKIISLDQLIDIADEGHRPSGLYLETKLPLQFPGIENDLKELLIKRNWYQEHFADGRPKTILQTFSPTSLELLHKSFPETPLCYLWWAGDGCLTEVDRAHINSCLDHAQEHGAEIIGPSFTSELSDDYNLFEPWIIQLIQTRGLQIHGYTFETRQDIETFAPLCEGQFTNRTDLLLDYYGRDHKSIDSVLMSIDY